MKTEERLKAFFPPFVFVAITIICAGLLAILDTELSSSVLFLIIGVCFGTLFDLLVSERYRRFIGEEYNVLTLSTKGHIIRVVCILLFIAACVYAVLTARSPFLQIGAGIVFGVLFSTFTLNLQNSLHESPWLRKHMTKKE